MMVNMRFTRSLVTTLEDQGEGLVEDLLSVGDDAARGALVEIAAGPRRLAEEGGELLRLGLQLRALVLEG